MDKQRIKTEIGTVERNQKKIQKLKIQEETIHYERESADTAIMEASLPSLIPLSTQEILN